MEVVSAVERVNQGIYMSAQRDKIVLLVEHQQWARTLTILISPA